MGQGQPLSLVELDQGESGAGDLLVRAGQGADQAAGQGGLAGAQPTPETDHVARAQRPPHGRAEGLSGLWRGQIELQGVHSKGWSGEAGSTRST